MGLSLAEKLKKLGTEFFAKADEDEGREPGETDAPEGGGEPDGDEMDEKAFRKAMAKFMSDKPEELAKMLKAGGAKFFKYLKEEMPEMSKAFQATGSEIIEKLNLDGEDGATGMFLNGDEFAKAIVEHGGMQTKIAAHVLSEVAAMRRDLTALGEFVMLAQTNSPMHKAAPPFAGFGAVPGYDIYGQPVPAPIRARQAGAPKGGTFMAKAAASGWGSVKQQLVKMHEAGNEMAGHVAIELDMVGNNPHRLTAQAQKFLLQAVPA